jgi:hypothetical protein
MSCQEGVVQFSKHFPPLLWVVFQVDFMDGVRSESSMKKKGEREKYMCVRIYPFIKVFSLGEEVSNGVHVSKDMFKDEVEVL